MTQLRTENINQCLSGIKAYHDALPEPWPWKKDLKKKRNSALKAMEQLEKFTGAEPGAEVKPMCSCGPSINSSQNHT